MTQVLLAAALLAPAADRWPAERAWAWYLEQPWLVGCNYVPSTAVNDVEMWQSASFDPTTIDRELGWARGLGMNTVRVFLNYAVWDAEPEALRANFERFLAIADTHQLSVLPILFDDCFKPEPRVGPQEPPEPGVHNSQWVQSPGASRREDRAAWPRLEAYVTDLVGRFGHDRRVLAWELYNEPTESLALVEAAFAWARAAQPSQPLTSTVYGNEAMQARIIELSDVLCFHHYGALPGVVDQASALLAHGRPVLCTEWLARGAGSQVASHLPFFRQQKIACYNWGLVAGRTQTYYPWGSPHGAPMPEIWHHDLLHADGTPYSPREARQFRELTGAAQASPPAKPLVPTAELAPQAWRYVLRQPAESWAEPDFDDRDWQQGDAPFGSNEPRFGRHPRTAWSSNGIWLRRTFTLAADDLGDVQLVAHHDEELTVYLNGVEAARLAGFNACYERFDLAPAALAALHAGRNTLAVRCRQTTGGQFVDVGLERVPGAAR